VSESGRLRQGAAGPPEAPRRANAAYALNSTNNVYKASGAFIRDPVYQFVKESYPKAMGIAQHDSYIHTPSSC
jgi:hypothetical protein